MVSALLGERSYGRTCAKTRQKGLELLYDTSSVAYSLFCELFSYKNVVPVGSLKALSGR